MQGKAKLNLQRKEIARTGIWRETESIREKNLQGIEFAKNTIFMERNL